MNRILVVDDEFGVSELICDTLQRFGYAVDSAFTGKGGIQRFDAAPYDLVVTDMGLPDMDGNGVINHIRNSSRPFTPIIGISGTPWLLQGTACDATLPKPFPLRALVEWVRRLTRFGLSGASLPNTLPLTGQPMV